MSSADVNMKTIAMRQTISARVSIPLLAVLFSSFLSGCMKDSITRTYTILTPVFEKKSTVLSNIKSGSSIPLRATGKMYLYGKYIFLNEVNKGVHVFDNGNPSAPTSVAFINIPGNIDIAIKGNTLYADLYTDLLTIDISDPLNVKLQKQIPNVFPERRYGNNFQASTDSYIVDWVKKDTVVSAGTEFNIWNNCQNCLFAEASMQKSGTYVPGVGGSTARFTIVNNSLFAVNMNALHPFDISNPADPQPQTASYVGTDIETIYPFKNRLFIGSSNGMFIYDINNPAQPQRMGSFSHARACDPVVANDQYAYVTLRTGTACVGTANQLDVIDVSDLNSPRLVKTYPLSNPHGLAVDGSQVFICDGKAGLKVYNASNPMSIQLTQHIPGMDAYDVIAWNKKLFVVAANGLYQFDYSDPLKLVLISTIAIARG